MKLFGYHRSRSSRACYITALLVLGSPAFSQSNGIAIQDIFGRTLNENGVTLVDWDGYMANPAIKFFVVPPPNAVFPASATLSANNQRLYFDLPSTYGSSGPTKQISFADASSKVPVYLGNAPDRDSLDGIYQLTIQFTGANGQTASLAVPIHEIDQDQQTAPPWSITLNFNQDQTMFFSGTLAKGVIQQEVADWAYFFEDQHWDAVPAGSETTFIWNQDGFVSGQFVTNLLPYTGYLLYFYGIHSSLLRSGGGVSTSGGLETMGGAPVQLRRSGGVEIETAGNYNLLGWLFGTADVDWWRSGNQRDELNELFSIAHHETGHAIAFNPGQPKWSMFRGQGCVNDPVVIAYQGSCPAIDSSDHLIGSIDKESLKGAFGYEYFGSVPRRRWLITKLDLLVAQAVGYKLRNTSAFIPLAILDTTLASGSLGQPYSAALKAQGGIPFYNWTIASGRLPAGLTLNSFTGEVSGIPSEYGSFAFTIRCQDYAENAAGVTGDLTLSISVPSSLSISKTHTGNFTAGQNGATYTVIVQNSRSAASTTGTVTVTDTVPSGLALGSMSGGGWNCSGNTCSRGDALSPGSPYPSIIVTVNVASDAPSQVTNQASVSGGGSISSSASDTAFVQAAFRNSASFAPGALLAPDMIAFGQAAGIAPALTFLVASTNPWPNSLDGAGLDITDSQAQTRPAPIYFVTANSMGFLIPAATALGHATAKLTTSTGATIIGTFNVDRISPGLFTANATGSGVPAGFWIRVAASGTQSQDYLFDAAQPVGNRVPVPVDLGVSTDQVFLSLYGTGFRNATQATATVGGVPVPVPGFASVGIYQGEDVVNIGPLPRSLAGQGQVDVVIAFDGKPANTVTVTIR